MTRAVPQCATDLIQEFEGLRLTAYDDGVGIVTCGWGHVVPGGKIGTAYTREQCEAWLRLDLATAASRVVANIGPVADELTDNQFGALVSFCFNLGRVPSATIWKLLKARKFDAVQPEFGRFVKAGGKKLNGLVRRRAAEAALWAKDEPGTVDENPPSSVTRLVDTPPTPTATLTPAHIATAAVAAAGGVAEGAKQVTQIIQPYAAQSDMVQHALSYAATVGAGAAVAVALFAYLAHRRAKQ